jgi:hypothetical protein
VERGTDKQVQKATYQQQERNNHQYKPDFDQFFNMKSREKHYGIFTIRSNKNQIIIKIPSFAKTNY